MIYLFRHAHAGSRRDWDGPDQDRPLSGRGRNESAAVAGQLAGAGVTGILSSPYLRCVESVRVLSEATGLPIEVEPSLTEGADPERVRSLIAGVREGVVLCTHGDVVADLIGKAAAAGAALEGGLVWEKGSIWLLDREPGGRIRGGRYQPPPVTAV